jgi:hypothetical protein
MHDDVNADLWRANRRRERAGWASLAVALCVGVVSYEARPRGLWSVVLGGIGTAALISCRLLIGWARREARFLDRDQFKDPPSLLK